MTSLLKAFRVYIAPGCVFQSVMIGGGYGTGREVVEFFTQYGFWGGFLAIGAALALMALVLACTFEFARAGRLYDYRSFIRGLLGPFWPIFEATAIVGLVLILAVLAAAASDIFATAFDLPSWLGLATLAFFISILGLVGREAVILVLSFWSLVLYVVFIAFLAFALKDGIGEVAANARLYPLEAGWLVSGLKYAFYNLAIAPLVLYAVRPIETTGEAISAGVMAALIALAPGAMFHIAFFSVYPAIIEQSLPVYWTIERLALPGFAAVYSIVLLGTFVETGAGAFQGVFDRIERARAEKSRKPLRPWANAIIALVIVALSVALSKFGVIALVAMGYGNAAWLQLFVFILPVLAVSALGLIRGAGKPREKNGEAVKP